jgi:glycosyltransferase involved in cell wall biosynthesis
MLEEGDWQGRIIINGYVSNVAEWMAACDVLVVPAVREPLARVGVEAQSIGLPAIVSSDGGLVEVVQDGVSGLIVAPDNFEGWVSSVRRVLEDGELARRLAQGGLAAASNLTLERHADNIQVIYDALKCGSSRRLISRWPQSAAG